MAEFNGAGVVAVSVPTSAVEFVPIPSNPDMVVWALPGPTGKIPYSDVEALVNQEFNVRIDRMEQLESQAGASARDAGTKATAAGTAKTAAETAKTKAETAQAAAQQSATNANTSAGTASQQAGLATAEAVKSTTAAADAKRWANEFGVTVSSTTVAPGADAKATVTSNGPKHQINFEIPKGAKGDKGDPGEVSQAMLDDAVATLVGNAPEALNALDELAGALGNDPNFATTVSTEIGKRALKTDVDEALAGKANTSHSHSIGNVAGLQAALDSKAVSSHTHTWDSVTGKPTTFAPSSHTHTWDQVTGKPTTYAPTAHTHSKSEVGLSNVDNTADSAKPVSTAQQTALNGKEKKAWEGTQAQYNALATKEADRTYYIYEG